MIYRDIEIFAEVETSWHLKDSGELDVELGGGDITHYWFITPTHASANFNKLETVKLAIDDWLDRRIIRASDK